MKEALIKIIEKFSSGKFLITVSSAIIFMYVSFTGKIAPEDIEKILLIVFYAYFTKKGDEKDEKIT